MHRVTSTTTEHRKKKEEVIHNLSIQSRVGSCLIGTPSETLHLFLINFRASLAPSEKKLVTPIMSATMRRSALLKAGRLAAVAPAAAAATRGYATSIPARAHHQVLIVGAGTAGVTVAAQLKRARGSQKTDIAILDPATTHHYQVCTTMSMNNKVMPARSY